MRGRVEDEVAAHAERGHASRLRRVACQRRDRLVVPEYQPHALRLRAGSRPAQRGATQGCAWPSGRCPPCSGFPRSSTSAGRSTFVARPGVHYQRPWWPADRLLGALRRRAQRRTPHGVANTAPVRAVQASALVAAWTECTPWVASDRAIRQSTPQVAAATRPSSPPLEAPGAPARAAAPQRQQERCFRGRARSGPFRRPAPGHSRPTARPPRRSGARCRRAPPPRRAAGRSRSARSPTAQPRAPPGRARG